MKSHKPTATRALTATLLALGLGAATSFAQGTADRPANEKPYTSSPRYAELKGSDRAFFEKASKLGMHEVALSEVASERAIHQDVKTLAAKMVAAHSAVNADLTALAARKGVALPIHDENDTRKLQKQWSEKKAKNFDEDYLKELINAHQDSVDLFEKAVKSDDADLSSFAGQYLSAFKQHLAEAKAIKSKID